jgi:hypothetical protein
MVSYAKLHRDSPNCHSLTTFDQHANVLLIAFRYSDSQVNHHDTAGTQAGISIHVTKLPADVCSNCSSSQGIESLYVGETVCY